jgi:cytoskeletal protein CcmA (bactofilin family)
MKLGKGGGSGELNGFLDAGSSIRGDLQFDDNFRVDGRIVGRIVSKGDLVVGKNGEVDGEIEVMNLYVFGTLRGKVKARKRVEISAGSKIFADIETETFDIDDGAQFEGHCKMRGRGSPERSVGKISEGRPAVTVVPRSESRE